MMITKPIKAVLIDIDGCLNAKTLGNYIELESLKHLQEINKLSEDDPRFPRLFLNTGRPLNYAEVFSQILSPQRHFIFELGTAIARINGPEYEIHKNLLISDTNLEQMKLLERKFLEKFPTYQQNLQPGKLFMVTFLFPENPVIIEKCRQKLEDFIAKNNWHFLIDTGHNFINIKYPKIDKGTILPQLFEYEQGISYDNLAGIGDSDSDWDFMKLCAFSACPQNGSQLLKKNCRYVATQSEAKGTLEIIREIIKWNEQLFSNASSL